MNNIVDKETALCIEAQKKYAQKNKTLWFAPSNGICFSCGKNIFHSTQWSQGITLEMATNEIITGCPHCFRTFCD